MSTKRDLVEAHSFSRRRLVTAFVSGAPGGREVEPVRPGRMLIGGLGIAVLLVAGAAVAGVVKPRTPDDWLERGMVISKETGARYVIVEKGELHLLENGTSAALILGADMEIRSVPRDEIDDEEILSPMGILGAPDDPPSPSHLVGSGWSACVNGEGGMKLLIDDEVHVEEAAGEAATVVSHLGTNWLVTADAQGRVHRLELPASASAAQTMLAGLDLGRLDDAVEVRDEWLNLIPEGSPLVAGSFGKGLTAPESVSYSAELGLSSLRTGDLVTWGDATYLITREGPARLDDFATEIYKGLAGAGSTPRAASSMGAAPVDLPQTWPQSTPSQLEGDACAVLHAEPGEAARIALASQPDDTAAASKDLVQAEVRPGLGAYVRSADHGVATGGQQFLIDAQARRYKLGGRGTESATALGYDPDDAPTVPSFWIKRFICGPELSQAAALQAPTPDTPCADLS